MFMLDRISEILWGPATIILIIAVGLFFNFKTGFFPFRKPVYVLKSTFFKNERTEGVSPFSALATALSGCIGVGNIVGVATAIYIGGAGSVFWMWVSALISMMVKFAEVSLAMRYRVQCDGEYFGGPMYYLRDGMGAKRLAIIYAIFGFASAIGVGTIVQSNTVSATMDSFFGVPPIISALLLVAFSLILLFGESGLVFKLSALLCPAMVLLYLICCAVIIGKNASGIGACFSQIFRGAFGLDAAVGGGVGSAIMLSMRSGFSKSIFSNEAGVGTSSLAHAKSCEKSPEVQGMWGILEVFIDTILVCSATAVSLLCCGACEGRFGIEASMFAFTGTFGKAGSFLLAISITVFALSTIAAWTLYGREFYVFLMKKRLPLLYPLLFVAFVVLGALMEMKKVWTLTEIFNAAAMFPNLIGIISLSNQVSSGLKLHVHDDGKYHR